MLLGEQKTCELIGVRHWLEVQAARLAAVAISPESLGRIESHLSTMRNNRGSFEAFVAADMAFHQELAASAQNTLLAEMLQSVRSLIRVWVERALSDSGHAELTCAEHEAAVVALRAGDPAAAADAMSAHMDSAGRRVMTSIEARPTPDPENEAPVG